MWIGDILVDEKAVLDDEWWPIGVSVIGCWKKTEKGPAGPAPDRDQG